MNPICPKVRQRKRPKCHVTNHNQNCEVTAGGVGKWASSVPMLSKKRPVRLFPFIAGMLDGASHPISPNPTTFKSLLNQFLSKLLTQNNLFLRKIPQKQALVVPNITCDTFGLYAFSWYLRKTKHKMWYIWELSLLLVWEENKEWPTKWLFLPMPRRVLEGSWRLMLVLERLKNHEKLQLTLFICIYVWFKLFKKSESTWREGFGGDGWSSEAYHCRWCCKCCCHFSVLCFFLPNWSPIFLTQTQTQEIDFYFVDKEGDFEDGLSVNSFVTPHYFLWYCGSTFYFLDKVDFLDFFFISVSNFLFYFLVCIFFSFYISLVKRIYSTK